MVLITTKRGIQNEKPQLNLKYFTNFDTQIENFSILNANEFRNVMMDAAINTLKVDPTNETALSIKEGTILKDADTDWYKLLSQKASTNSVELSVRGGSSRLKYFTSFGMSFQNGVLKGDDLKRYTGRINLDWDVTSVLKFGTNVSWRIPINPRKDKGCGRSNSFVRMSRVMQRTVVIIRSVRQIIRWPKRRLPTGTMFIGLMGRYSGRPRLFRDFVFVQLSL